MAEVSSGVCVLPAAAAEPAAVDAQVYRLYGSGGVLLVADGALETTPDGDTLGRGALTADARGVLATAASGVVTRADSPLAAEWARKLEARRLAASLRVAPAAVQYVGADCTSATLGSDGGVPSQSPWVDKVWAAFAEAPGARPPRPGHPRATQHPVGRPPLRPPGAGP